MIYVLGKKKGRRGKKTIVTNSEIIEGHRQVRRVKKQSGGLQRLKAGMKVGAEQVAANAVRRVAGAHAGQQTAIAIRRRWDPEFKQRSDLARRAAVTRSMNANRSLLARRRRRIRGRFI